MSNETVLGQKVLALTTSGVESKSIRMLRPKTQLQETVFHPLVCGHSPYQSDQWLSNHVPEENVLRVQAYQSFFCSNKSWYELKLKNRLCC